VALLEDVLQASGGLGLWRQMRRFTLHASIGGALCTRKCSLSPLKDLVVEGSIEEQALEIAGFTASDRRAVYRPDSVALEGSEGQLLHKRIAPPQQLRAEIKATTWDELQLAYYCGTLIWNYVAVPFILAKPDVTCEELEPSRVRDETWRRLGVRFPPYLATHRSEQTFYFDRHSLLRRLDYSAEYEDDTQIAQLFSGHQRFSGILLPTLCRLLRVGFDGVPIAKPPVLDMEIFDAIFE